MQITWFLDGGGARLAPVDGQVDGFFTKDGLAGGGRAQYQSACVSVLEAMTTALRPGRPMPLPVALPAIRPSSAAAVPG